MNALTFLVRLIEPLLAAQAQSGEANSAVTYPFIPGSVIRGGVINAYMRKNGIEELDAFPETTRQLFFNGTVSYLNAYLAHPAQDDRMLPRPLSWFTPKDNMHKPDEPIVDFAIEPEKQWESSPKAPGLGDFVWQGMEDVQLGNPALQMTVHNASDERSRKYETASRVYRYDALAANQVFAGVIISDEKKLLLDQIKPLLETKRFDFGGSYSAGYGRAEIFELVPDPFWEEYTSDATKNEAKDIVTLTCLSDVILRGSDGQIGHRLDKAAGAKPLRAFYRMRLVGGFNRKWGLPLPQAWAIQAGSVFVFPASCQAALEKWVSTGIGERRAEGFGRVAVNWHTRLSRAQSKLQPREVYSLPPEKLSGQSQQLATRMAERQLQNRLDSALVKKINDLSKTLKTLPSPTQLSRARLAARRAWLKEDNLSEITAHFKELSRLTKPEWESSYVRDGEESFSLDRWICDLAENPGKLTLNYLGETSPQVAGISADFASIRNQTAARFIEGVLGRAVKKAKQERERTGG